MARIDLEARARKTEEVARADGSSPAQKLERDRESLEARERLAAADPKGRRLRGDLAAGQQAIGLIQLGLDRLDEARAALERARSLREELAREAPEDVRSRTDLAATTFALGRLEWKAGRLDEAGRLWREAEDRWSRAESEVPESRREPLGLAAFRREIGMEYGRYGLWALAAPLFAPSVAAGPIEGYGLDIGTAAVALLDGDEATYRGLCALILERLARPEAKATGHEPPWALVLAPGGIADPARALSFLASIPAQYDWENHVVAMALYRCGRFEEAVRRLRESSGRRRDVWRATGLDEDLLAMALHRLGREDEARRALEDAEAAQSRRARTILERDGEILGPWWDWAAALVLRREAERIIRGKTGPDPPLAPLAAARLYAKLGRTDLAEAGFRAAVEAAPGDPEVWLARGEILAELGHRDRAAADFARALDLADPPDGEVSKAIASDLASLDATYDRVSRLRPDDHRLRIRRIVQLARRGRWDRAALVAASLTSSMTMPRSRTPASCSWPATAMDTGGSAARSSIATAATTTRGPSCSPIAPPSWRPTRWPTPTGWSGWRSGP